MKKEKKTKVFQGFLDMFPNAITEVSKASEFGAKKYGWENWGKISKEEYKEALARHLLEKGKDPESGLDHHVHVTWNALALLEIKLKEDSIES